MAHYGYVYFTTRTEKMNYLLLKILFTKYYDILFVVLLLVLLILIYTVWRLKKKYKFKFFEDKRISSIVLIFTVLVGFLLRLYRINSPIADWHSFRQADTASVTRIYLENGIDLLHPKYHDISRVQSGLFNPEGYRFVEFPIYNFLNALLAKYLSFFSLEVWGRLISIFASLGTGLILFFLAKKLISETAGLIAGIFYLLLPYNIYFSRVILPEPLGIFFGCISLYLFLRFIETEKRSFLFLSGVALSIALLVKPYFVFYLFPAVFIGYKKYSFKFFRQKSLIFTFIIIFLPFTLWRIWMLNFPEGIPFWKWTFNGDGIRFKPAFWYWIFGERLSKLILGYFGLIPFFFGFINEKSRNFINVFLIGMFFYVSVFATANVRHDYYQAIAIPAVSLGFSSGLVYLWNLRILKRNYLRIGLIVLVFLGFILGVYQVKEFYKINHPEIVEAGLAVQRLTPKDALVIADYNGDTAFLYQTKRRGWPVVELPIEELISEGALYYASVNLDNPQTQEFIRRFKVLEKTDSYVILKLK